MHLDNSDNPAFKNIKNAKKTHGYLAVVRQQPNVLCNSPLIQTIGSIPVLTLPRETESFHNIVSKFTNQLDESSFCSDNDESGDFVKVDIEDVTASAKSNFELLDVTPYFKALGQMRVKHSQLKKRPTYQTTISAGGQEDELSIELIDVTQDMTDISTHLCRS